MEAVITRFEKLDAALKTVHSAITRFKRTRDSDTEDYMTNRDSLIHRFEYTSEMFWKYLRVYLEVSFKLSFDAPVPRLVYRKASELGTITKKERAVLEALIDNRNRTTHTYEESVAEKIVAAIPTYYELMRVIADRCRPETLTIE